MGLYILRPDIRTRDFWTYACECIYNLCMCSCVYEVMGFTFLVYCFNTS